MMKQLTIVILLSLIAISCETNPPTSPENPSPQLGKAFITANASDAEIWLDNVNTGQITPDTVETTVGTHTVTL